MVLLKRSDKHISADDLAQKGKAKRKKSKQLAQEKKKAANASGLTYRRSSDQRRVFTHITSWTDWKVTFLTFSIISATSLLPFLIMWLTMPEPSFFDPKDYMLFMLFWTVFWFLLAIYAKNKVNSKVQNEKKWIDDLPFSLIAYPDILVYRSYPSVYFTIQFKRKQPDLTYLIDVLSSAPFKIVSKVEFEKPERENDILEIPSIASWHDIDHEEEEVTELPSDAINIKFKFEMTNPKASKFNRHRRWARVWIHHLIEVQLAAIHDKYPIEKIILNDGTIELDFEWWVARKKWWKVF